MRRALPLMLAAAACGDSTRGGSDAVRSEAADVSSADSARDVRPAPGSDGRPVVLFVGTSLTAGYGLDDPTDAFPGLIQRRIDEAGLAYRVVNGGVSGDTSAGGLRRLDRLLRDSVAVLVLELGANDGLRGLPLDALRQNLEDAIALARARHPEVTVVLAGMEAPPNLGPRYTRAFRAVYREVAQDRGTRLIPFLLDGVAGLPELNQPDGIHPTAAGHRRIADLVWAELEPILSRRPARLSPRPAP